MVILIFIAYLFCFDVFQMGGIPKWHQKSLGATGTRFGCMFHSNRCRRGEKRRRMQLEVHILCKGNSVKFSNNENYSVTENSHQSEKKGEQYLKKYIQVTKKRALSPTKHRQQRSQTERSSKAAERWTVNKLAVDSP